MVLLYSTSIVASSSKCSISLSFLHFLPSLLSRLIIPLNVNSPNQKEISVVSFSMRLFRLLDLNCKLTDTAHHSFDFNCIENLLNLISVLIFLASSLPALFLSLSFALCSFCFPSTSVCSSFFEVNCYCS